MIKLCMWLGVYFSSGGLRYYYSVDCVLNVMFIYCYFCFNLVTSLGPSNVRRKVGTEIFQINKQMYNQSTGKNGDRKEAKRRQTNQKGGKTKIT